MKYVIAGGTGLIGQALAARCHAAADEVVILTRRKHVEGPGRVVAWDGKEAGAWTEELATADVVVNLCGASAGEGRWTDARKAELRASRLQPGRALVAAINAGPGSPLYLQASAVGFYGFGREPKTEHDGAGDDFLARLAVDWEACAHVCRAPAAILRFGVVLSRRGGAFPRMLLPFRLCAGGPLGSGEQWLSWIHLDDVVAALRHVVAQRIAGVVNVTAPLPVTNAVFSAAIGRAFSRPNWLRIPQRAFRLLLGEQADLLLRGQHVVPQRLHDEGFVFRYADISAALNELAGH